MTVGVNTAHSLRLTPTAPLVLMMEQPHSCECHCDAEIVAALDDQVVPDRAARLSDVADAACCRSLNVVEEREESIGSAAYACQCVEVSSLLFSSESLRLLCEVLLPYAVSAAVLFILVDVCVDDIVPVRTSEVRSERQVQDLVVLAEEPCVSLAACEPCAVNSRLLACAYADSLSVILILKKLCPCSNVTPNTILVSFSGGM